MESFEGLKIRPISHDDREWVTDFLAEQWGAPVLVTRGTVHHADELFGFAAETEGNAVGLVTYRTDGDGFEIVTLNSLSEGLGIGTQLLKAVMQACAEAGAKRLWAVLSNDNLNAIRFFQTRGFVLSGLYRNAMEEARDLKPEIPTHGFDSIPIRDEIEVEMLFQ